MAAFPQTLPELIGIQASAYGDKEALFCNGRRTSYAQLDRASSEVAQRLVSMGIGPGERIAYLGKNSDFFYIIWFGAAKARSALTALNFRLAAPEVSYILEHSGARILFVGKEFLTLAREALSALVQPPLLVVLEDEGEGTSFSNWLEGAVLDLTLPASQPEDVALLLYTSGTTGNPKGVLQTNANWMAFVRLCANVEGLAYRSDETVLNAMPLFHVAGTNVGIAALSQGARVVIVSDLVPAPVLSLIQNERVHHAFFVPAVIQMLLSAPECERADLSSLRSVAYGASPISDDLLLRVQRRLGCDLLQFYGMTETTGAGASLAPRDHDPNRGKLRACGLPWPGVEVRVARADGAEADTGEIGEVLIRAPTIMKGYFRNPGATQEALRDGWMHTGDAAYRDADGYFFICDRLKDMIVTGGENVYPAEVDNAIASHPDVADVAVIGVPDEKWGEAVKAIVVLRPGAAENAAAIIAWARARVANYKAPKSVDFVAALPRNPSGKVLRRVLRERYWQGRDRMVS